ncbi:uncharacterized protein LOC101776010 [Setaria italica]|uniref:uncharacterized protein LOC101776010 n=1 Tax=Setaria italica TaxID=4555 RepID=UPI0003509C91|nr:uncharacterized protein LOC101776010 [Setaria italica]
MKYHPLLLQVIIKASLSGHSSHVGITSFCFLSAYGFVKVESPCLIECGREPCWLAASLACPPAPALQMCKLLRSSLEKRLHGSSYSHQAIPLLVRKLSFHRGDCPGFQELCVSIPAYFVGRQSCAPSMPPKDIQLAWRIYSERVYVLRDS